jgi:rhodanese-related sulfurtransferase
VRRTHATHQEGPGHAHRRAPRGEFALGNDPGARNIPLSELKRRLSKLDRKTEIVAYCRGPYCVLSFEAVAQLRKLGFKVRRLQDRLPERKAVGLPVQTGAMT